MEDIYAQAKSLAEKMKQLKEELKRTEDDYNALIYEIKQNNILSKEFYLAETKQKQVNVSYFKDNLPDYYKQHAHIPHAYAVHIMGKVYGGEQEFQKYLMEQDPVEFTKHATITVTDVTADFKDNMDELKEAGAVTEITKSYTIKPKVLFQIQQEEKGVVE